MARILPLSPSTLPKRSRGTVFSPKAANPRARSVAVPINPITTLKGAAKGQWITATNYWLKLPTDQQATWDAGTGSYVTAFNNFMRWNVPIATWGLLLRPVPTPQGTFDGLAPAQLVGLDDGVTTVFQTATDAVPTADHEVFIHSYFRWSDIPNWGLGADLGYSYFGSFGPIDNTVIWQFDVTDLFNAFAGQYVYPLHYDTVLDQACGGSISGGSYVADQDGVPWHPTSGTNPDWINTGGIGAENVDWEKPYSCVGRVFWPYIGRVEPDRGRRATMATLRASRPLGRVIGIEERKAYYSGRGRRL